LICHSKVQTFILHQSPFAIHFFNKAQGYDTKASQNAAIHSSSGIKVCLPSKKKSDYNLKGINCYGLITQVPTLGLRLEDELRVRERGYTID